MVYYGRMVITPEIIYESKASPEWEAHEAKRLAGLDAMPSPAKSDISLPDTDDIAELCRAATPAAIRRLVEIALTTKSEAVAVAAIKEINDRGWGKAAQAIKGDYQFTLIVNTGVNAPAMLAPIEGQALPAIAAQIASDVASGPE